MKTMYKQNGKVWDLEDLDTQDIAAKVWVFDDVKSGTPYEEVAIPFKVKGDPFNIDVVDAMKYSVGKIEKIPYDDINHPKRYIKGGMECIDAIEAAISNLPGKEGFLVGQIIKYVWRYREKDSLSSLEKAEWYLKRLIEKVKLEELGKAFARIEESEMNEK